MIELHKLKQIRKRLNLTQNQFAKAAGISQSLIAKIEAKKIDPAYSKVLKIKKALKMLNNKQNSSAKDIMNKKIISISETTKVEQIIKLLQKFGISQIPVIDGCNVKGIIYEKDLLQKINSKNFNDLTAKEIMKDAPPIVTENTEFLVLKSLLQHYPLVIVSKQGCIAGIVTKSDILMNIIQDKIF
ncbi:MAG: CBS domain-containing protein [Nanoarchaeota archaeon]|nr:CBS domain-containing protein [Nanoarchaeota archaeon]